MAKAKISDKLRARVLARDNHICRACGFGGHSRYAPYLHCDHIISEKNGGETSETNLQCLCAHCNNAKDDNNWHFAIRVSSVSDETWEFNQKVISVAFLRDTAKRLRKLK